MSLWQDRQAVSADGTLQMCAVHEAPTPLILIFCWMALIFSRTHVTNSSKMQAYAPLQGQIITSPRRYNGQEWMSVVYASHLFAMQCLKSSVPLWGRR